MLVFNNPKMTLNISNLELRGKNIVIVEDDQPSIKYYETLLKNSGADIKIFHTGKEFVDFINQGSQTIDLVFMDFLIPLINGIECIRIFRKEKKNTPVIMITAYSSEQAKTEAYIAGCNEYVLKPIYPEKIFFLLEKYLRTTISIPYSY
jgi:DNA-binding response OmpR family regulator